MSTTYRVASGRSLALPHSGVRTLHTFRGDRFKVASKPGSWLKAGQELPESFVEMASAKIERNGQSLLANLVADGTVIVEE